MFSGKSSITLRSLILAIFAGLVLALLAVYPQWNLQSLRGEAYSGAFASCDLDEMAYASYLQALIDGRPRKNDPYTGRDHSNETPQPESLFSIQFVPAYLAAIPARVLGLSASQMMPVISAFSAFFTAAALFWLILSFTGDDLYALVGTLVVMTGSAFIVGIGAVNGLFEGGVAYPFFPYLRRPIPSLAFPFLFAFFGCLWNGLRAENRSVRLVYAVLAGICFAALVFSYFYVWTSAAVVLAVLTVLALVSRAVNGKQDLIFVAVTCGVCTLSLIPYAVLLAGRNEMMDKAQLLVFTRQPDLFRQVEVLGYAVVAGVLIAAWRGVARREDGRAIFIAAMAIAPCVAFNQQIVTGRSLQPFHYEFYVINYVVLLAAGLLISIFWKRFVTPRKASSLALACVLGAAAVAWGSYEATETTKFWDDINAIRDDAMPVNLRLRELASDDIEAAKRQTTLNLEPLQADSQPTVAPQGVLWARHQHTFAGIRSWEENKRRYYQILYYSDRDAAWLKKALTGCSDIEACMALFGWDRFNARLSANARPLTHAEIEAEVAAFDAFSRDFSTADAQDPKIDWLIVHTDAKDPMHNIDKWYQRDSGEHLGKYTLYRLTPR